MKRFRRKFRPKGKKLSGREKKQVKGMINRIVPTPELKQVTETFATIIVDNNLGNLVPLYVIRATAPVQWTSGSGPAQRIGTELWVKSIEIRFTYYVRSGAGHRGAPIRMILFGDIEGGGLTNTQMYDQTTGPFFAAAAAAGVSINNGYNTDLVGPDKRWRIYKDIIINSGGYLYSPTAAATDQEFRNFHFKYTFPFKGQKVVLPAGNISGDSSEHNAMHLYFVAANGAVTPMSISEMVKTISYYDA